MDHPDHGPLLMAVDVLLHSGYDTLAGNTKTHLQKLPEGSAVMLHRSNLNHVAVRTVPGGFPNRGAWFLTRLGVRLILAASTKPEAQAYIRWALGDVQDAIEDTGGYVLNEAARSTARADTRTHVPLPEG